MFVNLLRKQCIKCHSKFVLLLCDVAQPCQINSCLHFRCHFLIATSLCNILHRDTRTTDAQLVFVVYHRASEATPPFVLRLGRTQTEQDKGAMPKGRSQKSDVTKERRTNDKRWTNALCPVPARRRVYPELCIFPFYLRGTLRSLAFCFRTEVSPVAIFQLSI